VRWIAATTSWGLALVGCLTVAVAAQTQTPPVPPAQTPPASTAPPAKPATPPELYEQAWSAPIEVGRPIRLATVNHAVIVADSSSIAAFSLDDAGKELWRVSADPITAIATDESRVLIGSGASIRSLDPASGKELWRTPLVTAPDHIVTRGGWVIATSGSLVGAFRATNGTTVWQMTLGPSLSSAPVIDGDGLFAALDDGRLAGLDLSTGEVRWTTWLDTEAGDLFAANDRVYLGQRDGGFVAYRQATGEFNWRMQFRAETVGQASSDVDHVYVSLLDNTVRALDRYSGNMRWTTPLDTRPANGPVVAAGTVLIPSSTGEIMVSGGKDGRGMGKIAAPTAPAGSAGGAPRLVAFSLAAPAWVIRLVANGDGTLTLAAYKHTAGKPKAPKVP
jgi:outer membrane protein assembly factor BamB